MKSVSVRITKIKAQDSEMTMDEAKAIFDELCVKWKGRLETIDNEADTRFQLIDLILTDVLGWERLGDFSNEVYSESGFADYILNADSRPRMVVEAKRAANMLIDNHVSNVQYLMAKSVGLKSAQAGMRQAQGYCVDNGVSFSVLTSGVEWIGYWATRIGKKPSEGKVVAFPSLESIAGDFAIFWDLFSKQAVLENRYQAVIAEAEGISIQMAETLRPLFRSNDLKLLKKSQLAHDLDGVFRKFFTKMTGDDDPEMLTHCFVESKESREADISLDKISSTLLNRLETMSSENGSQLEHKIENAVDSMHGEFVLIIGNKGAGKSTFIDRFFTLVLAKHLRERCIVLRIDVGDSAGDTDGVVPWLDKELLLAVEHEMFSNSRASYEQLQGIFYSEYQRWRDGPHKILYTNNKDEFKQKFGEHLEKIRGQDPHTYILALLNDIVKNRKKMPCIVLDNTDHFNEEFQNQVFQYGQSIFRRVFSFVICPITDRTVWQLAKHGPLQSYATTSFFLPVPAMKEVLAKRVNFLKSRADDMDNGGDRGNYFLSKGIRLNVRDIKAFAACVEEIFVSNEGQSRVIGSLANFDVRRSLQLSQLIMTSPHLEVEELVKLYLTDGSIQLKQRQINYALICGDLNHFDPTSSDYIIGIFTISGDKITSPLIRLSILRLMLDIEQQTQDVNDVHITLEKIYEYFDAMGLSRNAIKLHVRALADARLIDPFSPIETELNEESRLRVKPSGKVHYEWGTTNINYIIECALTTPLRTGSNKDALFQYWSNKKMTREMWQGLASSFVKYCLEEDGNFCQIPLRKQYQSQLDMRQALRTKWLPADAVSAGGVRGVSDI